MTSQGDAVLEAIRSRRVVRNMTDEPIAPSDIAAVLSAMRFAPNAGNRRLHPVVAVTDPARLRLLRLVAPGMLARPAAAVVICIDVARAVEFGFVPDHPGLFIDVGTSAATGLLAEPVTSFSRAAVGRLLDLPPGLEPRMMLCLGHAAVAQPPAMGRWASAPAPDGDAASRP